MPCLNWKKFIVDWVPWFHHRTLDQLFLSSFLLNLHKQEVFIYLLPLTIISLATRFFIKKKKFIWLRWVLLVALRILYLCCGIFLAAAYRIFSCSRTVRWGMWGLVPWQENKRRLPALGEWSLSHYTTRKVPASPFLMSQCKSKGAAQLFGSFVLIQVCSACHRGQPEESLRK